MSADSHLGIGLRQLVAGGLYHSGCLRMLQSVSRNYEISAVPGKRLPRWSRVSGAKFVILCYHRIASGGFPFISSVPPEAFEDQMRFLRKRYRIVSLDELCLEMENPATSGQAIAVTFDDGYRDLYTQAFPILQKYRIPATIFLIANSVESGEVSWYDRIFLATHVFPEKVLELTLDEPRSFELTTPASRVRAATQIVACLRRLSDARRRECCADLERKVALPPEQLADRMLTWPQIREMQKGGIAFGSHTVSHPVVSRLSATAAEEELRQSKRVLEERLGKPVEDFAFPFGQPADCGVAAEEPLRRCGYRSAVTTTWGVNSANTGRYRLRRVQIGEERSLALFAFRLGQMFLNVGDRGPGADVVARAIPRASRAEAAPRTISS